MSNHETRAIGHQAAQSLLNKSFGSGIDTGSRFVEQEDWGIFQESASDTNPLLFTHTEADATFPHVSIKSLRERSNKFSGISGLGRGIQIGIRGIEAPVENVFTDGAIEEKGLLTDDRDLAPQESERDLANIKAINGDLTCGHFVEARKKIEER